MLKKISWKITWWTDDICGHLFSCFEESDGVRMFFSHNVELAHTKYFSSLGPSEEWSDTWGNMFKLHKTRGCIYWDMKTINTHNPKHKAHFSTVVSEWHSASVQNKEMCRDKELLHLRHHLTFCKIYYRAWECCNGIIMSILRWKTLYCLNVHCLTVSWLQLA